MFERADVNKDDKIQFEEFLPIMFEIVAEVRDGPADVPGLVPYR